MRTAFSSVFLLTLLAEPHTALAQPGRELRGEVFHLGENGEKVYESGIVITWKDTGNSSDTNDQGFFHFLLPPSLQPGKKITLIIDKPGWRIRYPLEGETLVPASPTDLIKVELLPTGSKLFWTNDRIEKFIQDMAEAKQDAEIEIREGKKKAGRVADFDRYIKDWALRYGFTPEDAQKEIDRWVAETEANRDDDRRLGLADFAKKRFADAARHFHDSADRRARELEKLRQQEEALTEKKAQVRIERVHDLRLEGDSDFQPGDYGKALAAYE
nr:hypothetical protein [Acidobacteriota bacterium]